ncbi:hypothetical protein WJ970_20370 [Achromobacter xylosoxidans]
MAVVAQALLMLARVARTRFYVPPNTLAAVLRAYRPVVTSTPEGLRFESFSVCCGVYARLDVDAAALDATHVAPGVTNVDVNPPLRQALAGLRASEPLHLNVGSDALRVSTGAGEIVEEKVPLPTRWLKGFAETQMLSAGMACRHALTGAALRQFVQALPRSSSTKTVMWATQAARSLRLATQATPGAVCVAGPERLRVLEPLLRYATALRAYGAETAAGALPQASAWVLELPGARVTLGLSPEKARGSRARARCCIWSRAAMRMRTRRSCRRCWLSSRASISRSWPPGPCCPTRRSRPRWACWRLPARWGSIWRRARTSIARCRCRRGCWIRCIPGWPRRASWWPAAGCGAKARAVHGAIGAAALPDRAGRRARARPLHLPLARQVSRHARAVQAHAGGAHVS